MTTLYGIKNCDTVRKARRWLDSQDIPYQFSDIRETPLNSKELAQWLEQVSEKTLLNTRSTTWRQLTEDEKKFSDTEALIQLFLEHPTLIKRPVLKHSNALEVGFKEDRYAQIFADSLA